MGTGTATVDRMKDCLKNCSSLILLLLALTGCGGGKPEGVEPVTGFDADRYLGKWYEIARFDHLFEKGLSNVSATYRQGKKGQILVTNRGYDERLSVWQEADGIAKFTGDPRTAQLSVSFFGPFYSSYNVIELDHEGYSYAMVTGPDRSYLWILSRTRELPMPILQRLLERGRSLGFPVEKLIFVNHDLND